jgi:hypothetical protein
MARLLDVSAKTIERWETSGKLPTHRFVCRQLVHLQQIVELGQAVFTPEGFVQFLRSPVPVFDGRTALQLVELGEGERVVGALAGLYEGSVV